jgi:hypothetical protein
MNSEPVTARCNWQRCPGRRTMPGMKAWLVLSLAFLSSAGVEAGPGTAPPSGHVAGAGQPSNRSVTGMPSASTAAKPATSQVTVHRCTDPKGHVTLQDEPCP